MRRIFPVLVLFAFVCAMTVLADLDGDERDCNLIEIQFPEKLGPLEFIGRQIYNSKTLGVSFRYQKRFSDSSILKADIYIYDLGLTSVPHGIKSKAIKDNFKWSADGIRYAAKNGSYTNLKEISRKVYNVKLDDKKTLPFIIGNYNYIERGIPKASCLLVTGFRDNFLKIRFTFPKKYIKQGASDLKKFLNDLGKVLGKKK